MVKTNRVASFFIKAEAKLFKWRLDFLARLRRRKNRKDWENSLSASKTNDVSPFFWMVICEIVRSAEENDTNLVDYLVGWFYGEACHLAEEQKKAAKNKFAEEFKQFFGCELYY